MICGHCGAEVLEGVSYCHRCGAPAAVPAETQEQTEQTDTPALGSEPFQPPENTELFFEDDAVPAKEGCASGGSAIGSVGLLYLFEILCYIPVIGLIALAFIAGSKSPRAVLAQAKILARMTALLVLFIAAVAVLLLIYMEILPPLFLGRWKN